MKDAVFLLQVQAAWQLSPLPPHPDFAVRSEPPFAFCSAMSDNTVFTLKTAWIEPRRVNAGKMAVSGVVLEINKGDGTFRLSLLWRTWSVFYIQSSSQCFWKQMTDNLFLSSLADLANLKQRNLLQSFTMQPH